MADVVVSPTIILKLTDKEWRLVMKALGYLSGVKEVKPTNEDRKAAYELNNSLLETRRAVLAEQLKQAENTIARAKSAQTEQEQE